MKPVFWRDLDSKMKKSCKKVLLIFDLDGTLYNSASSFLPALKRLFDEYGIRYSEEEAIKFIGEPEYKFCEYLKSKKFNEDIDEIMRKMDKYEYSEVERSGELYPGVKETLENFKKKGYILILCSNGVRDYIEKVLKKFGLDKFFDDVRFPKDKGDTKEKMVREIIERYKPDITFMIGDRYHDMTAAQKNKIIFIGANYGFGKEEIEGARYKIESFDRLEELIGEIIKEINS